MCSQGCDNDLEMKLWTVSIPVFTIAVFVYVLHIRVVSFIVPNATLTL